MDFWTYPLVTPPEHRPGSYYTLDDEPARVCDVVLAVALGFVYALCFVYAIGGFSG